jgi:hypothetical protein
MFFTLTDKTIDFVLIDQLMDQYYGHCQCQKVIDDHLASQQFLTESHTVTRLASELHF